MDNSKNPPACRLWSLCVGARQEVISAPDRDDAWRIVRLLQDLGDLPANENVTLRPGSAALARRVGRAARIAGVDGSFLACLGGGMFITHVCGPVP